MTVKKENGETKERLLDEAEALFAQKGFDGVSVREITTAAKCNLAAVNYHFGNKKNLYIEVFRCRWVPRARRLFAQFENTLSESSVPSPNDIVQGLAQAFLAGPLSDDERYRHHQLISRELGRPSEAFDMLANEVMRPYFKKLASRLRPVMPEDVGKEGLLLNVLSIFAMVLYFNFAREAVTRITGRTYDATFKNRLVEHITTFALNGLQGKEEERYR